MPPLEACAHPLLAPDRWIFNGSGLLRLEARFRGRYDTRGAQDCHSEPPFELWTFELGPGALTCRVDPVLSNFVTPFGYDPTPNRTPPGYRPQPPPPPPPTHWRQSLSDERARGIVTSVKPAKKAEKKNQHSEWLHRYPDPVHTRDAPGDLDVRGADPATPASFCFRTTRSRSRARSSTSGPALDPGRRRSPRKPPRRMIASTRRAGAFRLARARAAGGARGGDPRRAGARPPPGDEALVVQYWCRTLSGAPRLRRTCLRRTGAFQPVKRPRRRRRRTALPRRCRHCGPPRRRTLE